VAAERLIPLRIGDVELLAEAVPVAGTEQTSGRVQRAVEHAGEAFSQAQETIVEVAKSTAEVIERAALAAARPDLVEVEFGLRFSVSGGVIMAGASGEASLKVTLTYDSGRQPRPAPQPDAPPLPETPGDSPGAAK